MRRAALLLGLLVAPAAANPITVRAALQRLHGAGRGSAEKYLVQPDPDAQRDADDHEHDD